MSVWFYISVYVWVGAGILLAVVGAISLNEYLTALEEED